MLYIDLCNLIIFYCTVANLLNHILKNKVATTYIIDSIIYMYLTYEYFIDVSCILHMNISLRTYVPYSNILKIYATTLIGPILWHNIYNVPKLMLIHHILSSTYILWFISSDYYIIETMLTCYYCTYIMGLDFIEFIHMAYKKLGYNITHTIAYVRYFDLITKIYGNISMLYIINIYDWNVRSEYSKCLSNILIISMFFIQMKVNKQIT